MQAGFVGEETWIECKANIALLYGGYFENTDWEELSEIYLKGKLYHDNPYKLNCLFREKAEEIAGDLSQMPDEVRLQVYKRLKYQREVLNRDAIDIDSFTIGRLLLSIREYYLQTRVLVSLRNNGNIRSGTTVSKKLPCVEAMRSVLKGEGEIFNELCYQAGVNDNIRNY